MRAEGKAVRVNISGTVRNPIVITSPLSRAETRIDTVPAEVLIR